MGRTDRVLVSARALGLGDDEVTPRALTFTSDDTLVAVVYGPIPSTSTGFLIAVGPGSTTIRARADGVTGTAQVGVAVFDTTFSLTHYQGAPLPALADKGSIIADGEELFFEIYADSGTLVLSGLLQERYELDVEYSYYRLIGSGDAVEREHLLTYRAQHDAGVVTVGADGPLSMLSELIGPHLEHTATLQGDDYLVHYRIPGEASFLDLRYERLTP